MQQGYLSQYFQGVAAKVLSAVEADPATSNQHEFNGARRLQEILGPATGEKRKYQTQFIYMCDQDDEPVKDTGTLTWYYARWNHPSRAPEARLYYSANNSITCASAGDNLFIALRPDDTILAVITERGSTIGNQLKWLFGVGDETRFAIRGQQEIGEEPVEFSSRFIIEQLGIPVEESDDDYLEDMLQRFGGGFPNTRVFSEYARSTLTNVYPLDDPDAVLMNWMEREEILFRTLEKHLILERLRDGFEDDVDEFVRFSLSVQNRRKSRVGQALENHVEQLMIARSIRYDRTKMTENRAKPDFIFPGIAEYHDRTFNTSLLTMLGVKSTCKDRWRQVLSEAQRIENKHLLTLEAAISTNQTDEMQANHLQLIVPKQLHETYSPTQQGWLKNMYDFIEHIQFKQRCSSNGH